MKELLKTALVWKGLYPSSSRAMMFFSWTLPVQTTRFINGIIIRAIRSAGSVVNDS